VIDPLVVPESRRADASDGARRQRVAEEIDPCGGSVVGFDDVRLRGRGRRGLSGLRPKTPDEPGDD
jgi:hypothetical protein